MVQPIFLQCNSCHHKWTTARKRSAVCPVCGSDRISEYNPPATDKRKNY